ncbi:MAG: hypothetical protein ACT6R6_11810 [Flavobacterium sp.]|uniref:hypothetical protein n=2 Tax=Flavobacterium sp. TaxID=239 RepID=UPI004034853E
MADTNKTSFGMKLLMAFTVLCLAFGAYKCTKAVTGGDETDSSQRKNSPQLFCGKEFTSADYKKEMDMRKEYLTILNCNGTYTSELNWKASSSEGEEIYNNTVGFSKGNFKSFAGSWEIVTDSIPSYLARQIAEYEDFEPNHMPKGQTTVIRFHSKGGRSGYAYIYVSNDKNETILTPVPSALQATSNYEEDDLHMYFGRFQN